MKNRINCIWNSQTLIVLFTQLRKQFGPLSEWKNKTTPGLELKDNYDGFCNAFAIVFGANSGEAVKNQISWAFTKQDSTNGNTFNMMLVKAIARDCEFIDASYIPNETLAGYSPISDSV